MNDSVSKMYLNMVSVFEIPQQFLKDILDMEAGPGVQEGNYYLLICKANEQALRVATQDPEQFEGSRVDCDKQNENDLRQIFLLDKVNKKDDGWQIVNCLSCLVMDEQKQEIRLLPGNQKKDQLFAIKPAASLQYQYFYIMTDVKGNKALQLEGCLRNKPFQQNRETQMFRFHSVNFYGHPILGQTALIVNKASGKAIDVPGASTKKGIDIKQWEKNNRFNQRWRFVTHGKGVIIQSLFNGKCLDVEGAKSKSGVPIIQWDKTGDSNQVWIPSRVGDRLYTFKSAMDQSLYLSVDKESIKDGARLETFDKESPSNVWEVIGHQPGL